MNTYLSLPLVLWSRRLYGQDASAGASLHKWFAVGTNHKQDDEKVFDSPRLSSERRGLMVRARYEFDDIH